MHSDIKNNFCSILEQTTEWSNEILKNMNIIINNQLLIQKQLNHIILNNTPTQKYSGGQRWDLELEERFKDKLFLDGFGYKVYSQNDEDGIINEIFNRIGTTNKKFIELGVQDGKECNSHLLLNIGWKGLWIEGSEEYCNRIKIGFKTSIDSGDLVIANRFITKDNINLIFKENGFLNDIDFLSVDIDGNDWYILKAILDAKEIVPRVICTEYNPLIPPSKDPDDYSTDWIMEYKEDWVWRGDDCHGASLSAMYHLLKKYNYQLVGTCINGVNAFFVKQDITGDKFPKESMASYTFYNPWRYQYIKYAKPFFKEIVNLRESMEYRISIYDKIR